MPDDLYDLDALAWSEHLKLHAWPDSDAVNCWRAELVSFQSNALRRFAPSMRQRIDLAGAYRSATRQVTLLNGGTQPAGWPAECPFTVEQLLNGQGRELAAILAVSGG